MKLNFNFKAAWKGILAAIVNGGLYAAVAHFAPQYSIVAFYFAVIVQWFYLPPATKTPEALVSDLQNFLKAMLPAIPMEYQPAVKQAILGIAAVKPFEQAAIDAGMKDAALGKTVVNLGGAAASNNPDLLKAALANLPADQAAAVAAAIAAANAPLAAPPVSPNVSPLVLPSI